MNGICLDCGGFSYCPMRLPGGKRGAYEQGYCLRCWTKRAKPPDPKAIHRRPGKPMTHAWKALQAMEAKQ